MKIMSKIASFFILSSAALTVQAATQSVTVQYTLTIPTACTLSNQGTTLNVALPHDATPVTQSLNVKCNVPYTIQASSTNAKGNNQSAVVNTSDATLQIPYDITMAGTTPVIVNGATSAQVLPTATTKTDVYTLTAKTPTAITVEDFIAGSYADQVTVEITY